jgi:hypothetical protein
LGGAQPAALCLTALISTASLELVTLSAPVTDRTRPRAKGFPINQLLRIDARSALTEAVKASLGASFAAPHRFDAPYPHWIVSDVFPAGLAAELHHLPFPTVDLRGVSGKRELHNDERHYFDAANIARFDACAAVADAFQSHEIARAIETGLGVDLAGTYVRLEYAQDTDGFWLEPHTDLGVKRFTMLIYLNESEDQHDLGTDLYGDPETWVRRTPFVSNTALVFIPGGNTWHGLARRPIKGVRKSVIMNYVTEAWVARSQLAYPDTPVMS